MARVNVIATFTGAGNTVDVTWSGTSAQYLCVHSVQPSPGFGVVQAWLTNRQSAKATVNVSDGSWQGTVVLKLVDSSSALTWPVTPTSFLASGSLPIPNSTTTTLGGDIVFAFPFWVPIDATTVNVKISNRQLSGSGGGVGNTVTINWAVYASDGTGAPIGSPLLTPQLGVVVPGDGTELSLNAITVTRGSDGKIVFVYSRTDGVTTAVATAQNYGLFATGTTTVSPLPGAWNGASPYGFLWVSPSYMTARRRIYVLGDSISIGVSGPGFDGSAYVQVGPHKDVAVCMAGCGGSTLSEWANPATYPELWTDVVIAGNDFYIEEMVNSLTTGLSQMQSDFTSIVNYLRANGANKIYSQTCSPQQFYVGVDATLASWNTWMLGNPLGLDGIVDINTVLRDPGAPTQMLPAYDSGDHIHPNAAGHNAMNPAIQAVVTP